MFSFCCHSLWIQTIYFSPSIRRIVLIVAGHQGFQLLQYFNNIGPMFFDITKYSVSVQKNVITFG